MGRMPSPLAPLPQEEGKSKSLRFVLGFSIILVTMACNLGQQVTITPQATPQIVTVVVTQVPPTIDIATNIQSTQSSGQSEQDAFANVDNVAVGTATPTTRRVLIHMIALDDNGKSGKLIGCNDSLIPVTRDIPRTASPLTDTLNLLFSLKDQYYGQSGLYNALYHANLRVEGISAHDGVFRVNLLGELNLGGVCDSPRVEAQIKETILQFSTVKQVNVFLNGKPLEDYFSEK